MKATEEQLKSWAELMDFGTITDLERKTNISRGTIYRIIKGEKATMCNFVKVYKYFKNLKAKKKRISNG
jgi:predicted transcriptional regulator